jgi:hypothetical protein
MQNAQPLTTVGGNVDSGADGIVKLLTVLPSP